MKRLLNCILLTLIYCSCLAQKKPLDPSVYDNWQSIGEKMISADGKWIAYSINVQEGDDDFVLKATGSGTEKHFPRVFQAVFSDDNRFLVAKIKPTYQEMRSAKIRKVASADMPKDSLLVIDLDQDTLQKLPAVKSFKLPVRGRSWLAVHFWKTPVKTQQLDSLARLNLLLAKADSLSKLSDSIRKKAALVMKNGLGELSNTTAPKQVGKPVEEGTDLLLRNLVTGVSFHYKRVSEYIFNKNGNVLVVETTAENGKASSTAAIIWQSLETLKTDTVMKEFHDARNFTVTETGNLLAFVAERDSSANSLKKYYKVWMYSPPADSAIEVAAPRLSVTGSSYIIQPEFALYFSKDAARLFIGLSPEPLVKDTSIVDFETAKLDLWNYQDDYLQPQQLVQLNNSLKKSWLAYIDLASGKEIHLSDDSCENIQVAAEGNSSYSLGTSSRGYRIQEQWTQHSLVDVFAVRLADGHRQPVAKKVNGSTMNISPIGKFIYWFDLNKRQWMSYDIIKNRLLTLSAFIPFPLFDEEDDHPDDPPAYGLMGWSEGDSLAYLYDRYDIWACDPAGINKPVNVTEGMGRKNKWQMRYVKTQSDETFISNKQKLLVHLFDEKSKGEGWVQAVQGKVFGISGEPGGRIAPARFDGALKARDADLVIYRKQSPSALNLYLARFPEIAVYVEATRVSNLNPQQSGYNWFTVELHKWKTFNGKNSEGLLYKPENFDPAKKYPVIFYFYERDAGNRYNYIEPMPVRASINIAYFTSNGYLVFDPNIYYTTGQPGEDAYNSVVSAANYLSAFSWVDKKRMGIQGHSWGGYQVAYLITRTNLFAAAEAGAPVSNMTSAYGGIRWGTGISRQFQYEKSQSRLGATLWEKPALYLKNSPLFRADKINTPVLILHNDKDDAVPWYQGIELFTALRRLDKPSWMVTYNDELHGIIERRNRKDWTIRMAQFFDHYLKNKPAPLWMTKGIPATSKGFDWGLGY